jgi:hypothetical protein
VARIRSCETGLSWGTLLVSRQQFPGPRPDVSGPPSPAGLGISRVLGSGGSSRHTANRRGSRSACRTESRRWKRGITGRPSANPRHDRNGAIRAVRGSRSRRSREVVATAATPQLHHPWRRFPGRRIDRPGRRVIGHVVLPSGLGIHLGRYLPGRLSSLATDRRAPQCHLAPTVARMPRQAVVRVANRTQAKSARVGRVG